MVGKKERLATAFEYLKSKGMAHKQQDVVDAMKTDKSNFSHALKGDSRFLTDSFLRRFNAAFGDIFEDKWLLTGEGDMLRPSIHQTVTVGHHSSSVAAGIGCSVGGDSSFMKELAAQRGLTEEAQRQTDKAQEQIDRLISIIEKMNK